MNVEYIQRFPVPFIIMSFSAIFTSLILGSIFLALTLYRYMRTRRLIAEWENRGAWWASDGTDSTQQGSRVTATVGDTQEGDIEREGSQISAAVFDSERQDIEIDENRALRVAMPAPTPMPSIRTRKSIYDRNLITRFSIGFAVLV
jgi:hypothetical protein